LALAFPIFAHVASADDVPPASPASPDPAPATEPAPADPATSAAPVESAAPVPAAPRTVTVNAVAFGGSPGKIRGSCSPVRVTFTPTTGEGMRVGFFESEVGGSGAMWRSAGWMAAVTGTLLAEIDPEGTRVSFEYEGRVDGPSAGALMTIGVIAAARGDTFKTDVAMTGAINPDGSIGPVGGIPHKIEGAAAKGIKLMMIPGGIRFGVNMNTGEQVDLVEFGATLGVKIQPVFDLYQAYELATGARLARLPASNSPQVALQAEAIAKKKIVVWHNRYADALSSYSKMPGTAKLSQDIIDLYKKGLELHAQSEVLNKEGEFSAAMWDNVRAAAYGYLALEAGRCRQAYAASGYGGMVARLRNNDWLQEDVSRTARRMREEPPRTIDQLSMSLLAYDSFLEAVSLQQLAKNVLDNLPNRESEEASDLAGDAAENQILAWLDLKLANDYLDMADNLSGNRIPKDAPWRDASRYLNHAADANTAVFDALIVDENAKGKQMTAAEYRLELMGKDKNYAMLQSFKENVYPNLQTYFEDGDAYGYALLASSMYTHTRAAGLIAKYYALNVELDDSGTVVKMSGERTLAQWLTFAEDQSRRQIGLLQSHGIDATPCAQMHDVARIKARRDITERLESLEEFWAADLHAQLLRRIGGVKNDSGASE